MNAREFAKHTRTMAGRAEREIALAVRETARFAEKEADRWSQGTFKARGEYAVRNPRPPQDPGIINQQSGEFRRAWTVREVEPGKWRLENTSPHAGYMLGTKRMIFRPVIDRIRAATEPVLRQNVHQGLMRAIGK